MSATEALAREIVLLVRGLRELSTTLPPTSGRRLDQSAAAVLAHVGDFGPLRLSELADRLCLDVSTVSRQVPALEREGWVDREADPGDRRAHLLRLTPAGREALADRRRAHAALLTEALPDWSEDELGALASSLSRFNTDLSAARSAATPSLQSAPALIAHDQKEAS
ncbi:MAG: marR 2 [Frankiales bacterium]|nr:marR 2 [Frankiales bacterium]